MDANLQLNNEEALNNKLEIDFYGQTDSTAALHLMTGKGQLSTIFAKQSKKSLREKLYLIVRNPADLLSRVWSPQNVTAHWWTGPKWYKSQDDWPANIRTKLTKESKSAAKMIMEVLSVTVEIDYSNKLLSKYSLQKTIRTLRWIKRFISK